MSWDKFFSMHLLVFIYYTLVKTWKHNCLSIIIKKFQNDSNSTWSFLICTKHLYGLNGKNI